MNIVIHFKKIDHRTFNLKATKYVTIPSEVYCMNNEDWHPADIIASLRKRGTNMAKLSRKAGLASSTLSNTLNRPWPKGEWLIAIALDLHPSVIWPSRYSTEKPQRKPRKLTIMQDIE